MIRDTSLQTYREIQPKLCDCQKQVIQAVRDLGGCACNAQIADKLDWPINQVTPRTLELRNERILVDAGKKTGPPYGRQVHYWKLTRREPFKETFF